MSKNIKNILKVIVTLITIAIILAPIYLALFDISESSFCSEEWTEKVYCVESGDTLWDIAEDYCPENVDIRDYIDAVEERNGIDSMLYAGQELIIFEYNK